MVSPAVTERNGIPRSTRYALQLPSPLSIHRHTVVHVLADGHLRQDVDHAAYMVLVVVGSDSVREPGNSFFREAGRDHRCVPWLGGVDQHRRSVRRLYQDRIRLPDVEKGDGKRIGFIGCRKADATEGEKQDEGKTPHWIPTEL